MIFLLFLSIASAIFGGYLAKEEILPPAAAYLPELAAIVLSIFIVFRALQTPERFAHGAYLAIFSFLCFIGIGGIIVNDVGAGPIFAALRTYLSALPLFLLPFFHKIDDRALRKLFWFLVVAAILQLPIAYEQRMFTSFLGETTGDWTVGTLGNSGLLSVFLVMVSVLVAAAYTKGMFGFPTFLGLLVLVLSPTTLNETKATVILAPVGILTVLVLGTQAGSRGKSLLVGLAGLAVFGALFVQIYDYFMVPRWGYGLIDFFLMEGRVEGYMSTGATVGSSRAGMLDGIYAPIVHMHGDITRWAFGYGPGNVSDSALGSQFTGRYFAQFDGLNVATAGRLVLELGILGFLLCMLFIFLVAHDSFRAAGTSQGMAAVFSLGTVGIAAIAIFAIIYRDIIVSPAITYLFAFLAGHAISQRQAAPSDPQAAANRLGVTRAVNL